MCRLLVIRSAREFPRVPHLQIFARICRDNKEYQGHGWGMVSLVNDKWETYKHLEPIWKHDFQGFGPARFLMVHARSAFRDQDIALENNMPFTDTRCSFMFNGELRGVKITAEGRIGAEKIFNFIKRLNKGKQDRFDAFKKGIRLIQKRTTYIRAMNIIMVDMKSQAIYLSSMFQQEPEYFTMQVKKQPGGIIIGSEKYPGETGWIRIPNQTIEVIR
jgi:predicted glutamine amidotransferase